METILCHNNEISSEIVLQSLLFVADVEIDDEEIKQGVPDTPKLEEFLNSQEEGAKVDNEEQVNENLPSDELEELPDSQEEGAKVDNEEQVNENLPSDELEELPDSQEEGAQVDNEEQVNKNLPPDEPDSDMEGKVCDTKEERSTTKTCGGCTI